MRSEAMKAAQKRYRESEKGKLTLKKYHQSDKFREVLRKYRFSEKGIANRKAHPEIYMAGIKLMLNRNVCGILQEHFEKLRNDPERLTTEFICEISGIRVEEKR
jgi:hypothetical protein